jgi:hypothetical protein
LGTEPTVRSIILVLAVDWNGRVFHFFSRYGSAGQGLLALLSSNAKKLSTPGGAGDGPRLAAAWKSLRIESETGRQFRKQLFQIGN